METQFESVHALPVLETIRGLGNGQRVRSGRLKQRLCDKTGLAPIEVEEGIRELHRRGLLMFKANSRGQPVSGYVEFIKEEIVVTPEEACWKKALSLEGFDAEAINSLNQISSRLTGMVDTDIQALAKCLANLRESARLRLLDGPGSNVSARMVMGSAKVISGIPAKAMALLGLDACLQRSSPRYVIHAGPDHLAVPDVTLLIENPQAFENAIAAGLAARVSLVCTFGFAISYLGQSILTGPEVLPHERPIVLQRCGRLRDIAALLAAPRVLFWGDLDIGALKIFLACRAGTPALRLSGIYRSMEALLDDPTRSHPYADIFDKFGQSRLSDYPEQVEELEQNVKTLFTKCARRGVDQEIVDVHDIAQLGDLTY